MKLSLTKENFQQGLQLVSRMTGNKITLPVLNNILLETIQGRLKLSATDLEIGITTSVGAKIEEEGTITLPSRLLVDYIIANTDQSINIELKGSSVNLTSQNYQANIKGIEAKEFPKIPKINKPHLLEIESLVLKQAINQVSLVTAIDEARPVLTGVYWQINNSSLKIAATDSYRLAEKTIKIKINPELTGKKINNFIIPSRTVIELGRIIDDTEEKVKIFLGDNQVMFQFKDTELVSRLIEGEFPNYQAIIPQGFQTKIIVPVVDFLAAAKMASYFAKENAGNIKLKVEPGKLFHIKAISPQIGDEESRVVADVSGERLDIAFNAKFLIDALSVVGEEQVVLELGSALSPGILKPVKKQDYWHIIMPLKIED